MFSSFKKAFKVDESSTQIPQAVLEGLNDKLPSGFEYVQIDKDTVGVVHKSGEMKFNLKLKNNFDFKPKNPQELMEYLYRTQQKYEVPSKEINVNGHKFKLNEFITFPLSEKSISDEEFVTVISPKPFPPPFPISIKYEEEGIDKKFLFRRQPYADMSKSLFQSEEKGSLTISYIIDEEDHGLNLSINFKLSKAHSVEEVVETLMIYMGFIQGKIKFAGEKMNAVKDKREHESMSKILNFWKKVKVLGDSLDLHFQPKEDILASDVLWVEKLYRSYIENKPYKEYITVDSVITETAEKIDESVALKSNGLSFQFIERINIELLGVEFGLFNVITWFNFRVVQVIQLDDTFRYKFLLESTTDQGIYQTIKHFLSETQANDYRKKHKEIMKELEEAEELPNDIY